MITATEKVSIYLLALTIKLFMLHSVQDVYQRIHKIFTKDFGPLRPSSHYIVVGNLGEQ